MKKLSIVITAMLSCIFIIPVSSCGLFSGKDMPFYGTYQATSSTEKNEVGNIKINSGGVFINNEMRKYNYNDANKSIIFEKANEPCYFFNNYEVLAMLPVFWHSFEFTDNYNGTVNMRCISYNGDYSVATIFIATDDGTFSFVNRRFSVTTQGTYRFKDGFLRLDTEELGGYNATYINGDSMYAGVWIKNYDSFWNGYSRPSEPTIPEIPELPSDPEPEDDFDCFTDLVQSYGGDFLSRAKLEVDPNGSYTFELFNKRDTLEFFSQYTFEPYISNAVQSGLFIKVDSQLYTEGFYIFCALKLNTAYSEINLSIELEGYIYSYIFYPTNDNPTIYTEFANI